MAYTSFRLRKTNTVYGNGGSALQRTKYSQDSSNPTGTGTNPYDSGLRSDNYVPTIPIAYTQSSFSAEVITRTRIDLSWKLEVALTSTLTAEYLPTTMVIRASNDGEPVTVGDGYPVVTVLANAYTEQYSDEYRISAPYIAEGKWVYYSMFILYENNAGGAFYERVADLSVQVPFDFGSTNDLLNHIPMYYRALDSDQTPLSSGLTPLHAFVDLFGWELDKMRTTIYDTMRISDPEIIHSSAIDALGKQVGVEFTKDMLGTAKLRAILNNIGYLRRTKGTVGSVEEYIAAISGCGVTVDSSSVPISFSAHPHRVNLFTDPFFNNAPTTTDSSGPIYRKFTDLDDSGREYGWGVFVEYPSTPASAPTISVADETVTVTLTPQSGSTAKVVIYSRGFFDYNNDLVYYGSAETTHPFSVRFIGLMGFFNLETSEPISEGLYFLDWWNDAVAQNDFPSFANMSGRQVVGSIPSSGIVASIPTMPVFVFDVALPDSGDTTLTFSKPLFEYRHSHGDFFSGNEPLGGFLPVVGSLGEGTYDYHWGQNGVSAPHTDFSYYTLDFYRSKKVAEYVVDNYVVPVTLVKNTDYTINWDVLE